MAQKDIGSQVRLIVDFPDSSTTSGDGVDAILAPIFKEVLEHDAGREFTDQLDAFTQEKVAEIEDMCNTNHQEFVGAVEKLLKVRKGAAGLRSEMLGLNDELQDAGAALTAVMREQIEGQTTLENIDEAIDTLNKCLRVLGLANRVNELIEKRKSYAALRALDELENVHLNEITRFDFAEVIRQSIPATRQVLQDSVVADLQTWLLKIREKSKQIGELAFRHTEKKREEWRQISEQDTILSSATFNSALERIYCEQDNFNPLNCEDLTIDFRPLFEAMHIYSCLGKSDEFRSMYEADRRKQMDLLLPSSLPLDDNGEYLHNLLADVTGFSIIERASAAKAPDLRTVSEIEELWDILCSRVTDLITESVQKISDPSVLLSVKDSVLLFLQTIQRYDFSAAQLDRYVFTLFKSYSDVLKRRFSNDFNKIIQDDAYMPMTVETPQSLDQIRNVSLYGLELDIRSFPYVLPFSELYPLCCSHIRNFVNEYYMFSDECITSQHDVDDILRKSLDELLVANVNVPLSLRLDSTNLAQIVQILINLEYLENACIALEELLMQSRSTHRAGILKLAATSEFGSTRNLAEKRVFELVNSKIDDFLGIADYDWVTMTKNTYPSAYLQDVVAFLTTVVSSTLQYLPQRIKTFVYFEVLDHLATSLKDLLLSAKRINENAIANFDLDIQYLEDLVQNLGDASVANADTFLELRQSINLLKSENNMEEYMQMQPRMRYYNRISVQDAVSLFEKLLNNLSSYSLNPQQRERRRALENTISVLKGPRPR